MKWLIVVIVFLAVLDAIFSKLVGNITNQNSEDSPSTDDPYKADDHWDKNNTSR